MSEPKILKRGKLFHQIVQRDFEAGTKGGGVIPESFVSFVDYTAVKKQSGRIDIFIKCEGDSVAIFEIKATNWDRIKFKNVRRNIYRHQKQLFDYVYKYYEIDELFATIGVIYPSPPNAEGLREYIEDLCENDYFFPAYWYSEISDDFDMTVLE
ncbi:MAG: hypothetical protein GKR91_10360 [Pseudomonadales bacterium]|nr:hypothetical protein [Pseudomonadales bacterium]